MMAAIPHNLPLALSSFIGREPEMNALAQLMARSRLVTLTGAGGSGKTRLALEFARRNLSAYPDGSLFVSLAPLADESLLLETVAAALDISSLGGRPLWDVLFGALHDKQFLLVLDNCEHIQDACAHLVDRFLRGCPQLSILATSRTVLKVEGEQVFQVPTLPVPELHTEKDEGATLPLEKLAQNECVRLFVKRAQQTNPHFVLDTDNASAVVHICQRLEGIPLALELAAARVNVLSAEQILARLDDALSLLGRGAALEPRQQTMRASLDWSYNLLTEPERVLFRRLAVFADSWNIDAAEQICGHHIDGSQAQIEILDRLADLVDSSLCLVTTQAETTRYRLLEPVRQYALEMLNLAGEQRTMQHRHLVYFLHLATEVDANLHGPEQLKWLARLDIERDNLRYALEYAITTHQCEAALQLAGCLGWYWHIRSNATEGRNWLERTLLLPAAAEFPGLRASALVALGGLIWIQTSNHEARPTLEHALTIARAYGDRKNTAFALGWLGVIVHVEGDSAGAVTYLEESRSILEKLGIPWGVAYALWRLGFVTEYSREGNAQVALERALTLYQQGLSIARECGDQFGQSILMYHVGLALGKKHIWSEAQLLLEGALSLAQRFGTKFLIANALCGIAGITNTRPSNQLRLLGAAARIFQSIGALETFQAWFKPKLTRWQSQLDEKTINEAYAAGYAMSIEQAVKEAKRIILTSHPSLSGAGHPAGLTTREVEVLRLVARGLTNQQIADDLVLSRRTVHAHLRSIYNKLDVTTRNAATRAALDLQLD